MEEQVVVGENLMRLPQTKKILRKQSKSGQKHRNRRANMAT